MAYLESDNNQLADYVLGELASPLITGVGESLPLDPASDGGHVPTKPEIVVCFHPAPDCETQPLVDKIAERTGANVIPLKTGPFWGLQAAVGDSASFYTPSIFGLPPEAAGTLGAVVKAGPHNYALGSNHVLAHNGRTPTGAAVVSPGTLDDINGNHVIGSLAVYEPLLPAPWPFSNSVTNDTDCAVASLTGSVNITQQITPMDPSNVTAVHKQGRTTGKTSGSVVIGRFSTLVELSFGTFVFANQFLVQSADTFASPGDSGSVVVTDRGNFGIGLVTARAYSPGYQGKYRGYLVMVCPLTSVSAKLAALLNTTASQLQFWV